MIDASLIELSATNSCWNLDFIIKLQTNKRKLRKEENKSQITFCTICHSLHEQTCWHYFIFRLPWVISYKLLKVLNRNHKMLFLAYILELLLIQVLTQFFFSKRAISSRIEWIPLCCWKFSQSQNGPMNHLSMTHFGIAQFHSCIEQIDLWFFTI
jgi:hypothetical protein